MFYRRAGISNAIKLIGPWRLSAWSGARSCVSSTGRWSSRTATRRVTPPPSTTTSPSAAVSPPYFSPCTSADNSTGPAHGPLLSNNNNNTHLFFPVAIETAGTWNQMAVELVQEIGRRITLVTEDRRETVFLFQRLSIALQRGNAVSFLSTFTATD